MIREQSTLTRMMFYILLVMIGILAALIALHMRQPNVGLMLLAEEEGGVRTFGHIDSYGLTEVVQDEDGDGIYEHHIYRVAVDVKAALLLAIGNESGDRHHPDTYALQFTDENPEQRSVLVTVTQRDVAGVFRVCKISFSDDGAGPDTGYSDWDFDGRIDVELLESGKVMNVRMGDRWLPVLMDKPMEEGEYVTVSLDGAEARLNFLDGEFVTATP